jgi:hypothetical protein
MRNFYSQMATRTAASLFRGSPAAEISIIQPHWHDDTDTKQKWISLPIREQNSTPGS